MPTPTKSGSPRSRRTLSRTQHASARPRHANPGAFPLSDASYHAILGSVAELIEVARATAARSVNAVMTATYWAVGRRVVEAEQQGRARAPYGEAVIRRLAEDLTARFGRGFGARNLSQMRAFYLAYRDKVQTASARSRRSGGREKVQTLSAESSLATIAGCFPLPWSHYVRLLALESVEARSFYEAEALRSGWTVRQLDRQIGTQFYERTALSRNKAAMLRRSENRAPSDEGSIEEQIKDPFVLEFLGLKDEYSETDLEDALIRLLEAFLLELGGEFTFVGRQRRLRVGDEWYRIDLLLYHRRLRCLVLVDLKLGRFTHADAGQMHLYLNYASEHWTLPGENPPVGLILCAQKDAAVARYALDGLPNKVLAAEYRTTLPDERLLAKQIERTRELLERSARRQGIEEGARQPARGGGVSSRRPRRLTSRPARAGEPASREATALPAARRVRAPPRR
jgi:predicted nuclease of restriction endonuclease-like (RecB) superfamily